MESLNLSRKAFRGHVVRAVDVLATLVQMRFLSQNTHLESALLGDLTNFMKSKDLKTDVKKSKQKPVERNKSHRLTTSYRVWFGYIRCVTQMCEAHPNEMRFVSKT